MINRDFWARRTSGNALKDKTVSEKITTIMLHPQTTWELHAAIERLLQLAV